MNARKAAIVLETSLHLCNPVTMEELKAKILELIDEAYKLGAATGTPTVPPEEVVEQALKAYKSDLKAKLDALLA